LNPRLCLGKNILEMNLIHTYGGNTMDHRRLNGFFMHRRKQRFTEPIKFAVVAYGETVVVFARCEYEAVEIATHDPNLREYYPLCFDGYVFARHLDGDVYEDPNTYDGYRHPDDFAQSCSTMM
jgi:hypothetical protein